MKVWREGRLEEASTSIGVAEEVEVEEGSSGTPGVLILVGVVGGERREVEGLSTTMTEVALAARVPAKKRNEGGRRRRSARRFLSLASPCRLPLCRECSR